MLRNTIAATVIATTLALGLGACSGQAASTRQGESGSSSDSTSTSSQIANPWVDCETLEDAAKLAGFTMTAPESIAYYQGRAIQATEGETIQVIYGDSENGDTVMVRKAQGEGQDISGDYNEYAQSDTLDVDGVTVSLKGDGSTWNVATWSKDGSSFSIDATAGLDADAITQLVSSVE